MGGGHTNVETTFKKILLRNGIAPWPQPFHALRSFRINEMERDPNLRTVEIREYTGNSEATARKHYSRVSREDRQRAAKRWPNIASGPTVDDGSHQKGSDRTAEKTGLSKNPRKKRSELIRTDSEKNKVHPRGFEPLTFGSVGDRKCTSEVAVLRGNHRPSMRSQANNVQTCLQLLACNAVLGWMLTARKGGFAV